MTHSWKVFGASVQGTMHIKSEKPCQDAFLTRSLAADQLVIAVADGAGTAAYSDAGANIAVQSVIDHIEAGLDGKNPTAEAARQIVQEAFQAARQAVSDEAEKNQQPVRSLASTLTVVLMSDSYTITAQIGDGVAVGETQDGVYTLLTSPQRGEYANETYFLTDDQAASLVDIKVWEKSFLSMIVMTDGLIRLAFHLPDFEPHEPFFRPLTAFALKASDQKAGNEKINALLASKKVCDRTQDDKSMVVAVYPGRMV